MSKPPLVSIVVLSWNTIDETKECLTHLRRLNYPEDSREIIVVDNGSTDGSKDYLAKQKDIEYIDLPENTGFTGGQIAAEKIAKGEYLALVNSDAVVDPDWLTVLVDEASKHKDLGVIGGKSHLWNEEFEVFDRESPFYSFQIVDLSTGYAETAMYGEEVQSVHSISGAGLLINRQAVKEVGYFDDRFFAYYEETDLIARMIRAGYKAYYTPAAHMWHKIAVSSGGVSPFYLYQMQKNRFLYAYKNFDPETSGKFTRHYVWGGIKALPRAVVSNQEAIAKTKALWWNMLHYLATYQDRRQVKNLGKSYNKHIKPYKTPTDVTVIIPCYNYENYVGEAIESVLNQTLKAKEIIVINDGSTDGSLDVIKKYEDRVTIIDQKNEGVIAAKNKGINKTKTFWSIMLDSDDILKPDYIEKTMNQAIELGSDVVYTDMQYFGANDDVIQGQEYDIRALTRGNYIHNSALIKSSRLKASGGYKPVMKGGYEDWELYLTLAERGANMSYLPETLLLYRQHDSAMSRNQEALNKAKSLHAKVEELHAPLFKQYKPRGYMSHIFKRAGSQIRQHPEIIFIGIFAIPAAIFNGIKSGAKSSMSTMTRKIRTYLHDKYNEH